MKVLFEFVPGDSPHRIAMADKLFAAIRPLLSKGESVRISDPESSWFTRLKRRVVFRPEIVHHHGIIRRIGLHRARTFAYPGVDLTEYHPRTTAELDALRQRLHLPEKFLLMWGPDLPVRNLATVVTALTRMDSTETLPLVVIDVAAKSPLRREVQKRKIDVTFLPEDAISEAERPLLFAAAMLYLDPGLGSTARQGIVEALASGTPVISSAMHVSRKLFGGVAKLVHPKDSLEWARAIRAAEISLEWHDSAAERGLELAKEFEWPKIAAKLLSLYRKLYEKKFFG